MNHKNDFGVDAEWHFFETAHGKRACDGISGCIKRNAYLPSLQNTPITTTENLFERAKNFFNKINFEYSSVNEYEDNKKKLEVRFSKAKAVKGTISLL